MTTYEEMIMNIQQGQGNRSGDIPVSKIDMFIDTVINQRDETLYSLAQALQWKLQRSPIISFPELEVYPLILQRIQMRLHAQQGK